MYAVYNVKPADKPLIDAALDVQKNPAADLVTRQSVVVRDAAALGLQGLGVLVLVEGEDRGVKASEPIFAFAERLTGEKAETARRAFHAQDDAAAAGVGFIFGD